MKALKIYASLILIIFFLQSHAQTFSDNLSQDNIGDIPSKWILIKGYAQVERVDGKTNLNLECIVHFPVLINIINQQQ